MNNKILDVTKEKRKITPEILDNLSLDEIIEILETYGNPRFAKYSDPNPWIVRLTIIDSRTEAELDLKSEWSATLRAGIGSLVKKLQVYIKP